MKRLFTLVALLCCALAAAQQLPPCARPDSSYLHFPASRSSMEHFARKLQACKENPDSSATIWHIGGSHVQAGWFPSRLRHNFDSLGHYPYGGRGYIFPYPLARTNYDRSYNVSGEGEWTGTISSNPNRRMPVSPEYGIMGIAACTCDSTAAIGLGLPAGISRLHILGSAGHAPFVIAASDTLICTADSLMQGYVVDFPQPVDSVRILPHIEEGEYFTITGLLPEMPFSGGLSYVSTGVNGARTTTWTTRCPQFEQELSVVHPDLAILGLGINDSACPAKDFNPERFKSNYRKLIEIILRQSPDCALLFITNNDSWRYSRRRMVHNANGAAVVRAMYELAAEYGGAVWDLYEIMGGGDSSSAWREAGLMKRDRLHFTKEGYQLLGDMLYEAIINACEIEER